MTMPTKYLTGDGRRLDRDAFLRYLEDCAKLWETREKSPKEAARVRDLIGRIASPA